jgi:hypothetical protein
MRTHPLIALAVAAAAITTVTVFGESAPTPPTLAAKKPRHADALSDARTVPPAASTAVPAWLAPLPAAPAAVPRIAAPGRR